MKQAIIDIGGASTEVAPFKTELYLLRQVFWLVR